MLRGVSLCADVSYASVQLLHETPDAALTHIDWMISTTPIAAGGESGPLLTFRAPRQIGERAPERLERIADHRPRYLDYEGPLSGGRGRVEQVWRGVVTVIRRADPVLLFTMRGEDGDERRLRLIGPADNAPPPLSSWWRLDVLDTDGR